MWRSLGEKSLQLIRLPWAALGILSLVLMSSSAQAQIGRVLAAGAESQAVDSSFLRDEIEVEIRSLDGASFIVKSRPGQTIYVTTRGLGGKEMRWGIVIMPESEDGQDDSITREEVLLRDKTELTFYVMPVCVSPRPDSTILRGEDGKIIPEQCPSWPLRGRGEAFPIPFFSRRVKSVYLNQEILEPATSTWVNIREYRQTPNFSPQQNNPFGKCCREVGRVETCSCAVVALDQSCNAGCAF